MRISTILKRYKKSDTKSIEIIESQGIFRIVITSAKKEMEQETFAKTIELDVSGFQIEKSFGYSKIELRKYFKNCVISIKFDILKQLKVLKS